MTNWLIDWLTVLLTVSYWFQGEFSMLIWAALREKVPNVLSRRHTKRRTRRVGPGPPFFWYDTDFLEFFEKKIGGGGNFWFYLGGGSRTQEIRDLFA